MTYAEAGVGLTSSAASDSRLPDWGSHWSHLGRYQFQSPSSFIVAGRSTARTIVASSRIAVASPTPNILKNSIESVPKIAKTQTITIAALVTTPAVDLIPCAIASLGAGAAVERLADPADDEDVVVHREPEQDHEQQQRHDRVDAGGGAEAEQPLAEAVLEDEHQHAVGGRDREQVEQDRLDRDHERAEGEQHQGEREQEHEREHERQLRLDLAGGVLPLGGEPGDAGLARSEARQPSRGTICVRRVATAAFDAASVPVPSIGMVMFATVASVLTSTVIGLYMRPLASARFSSCSIAFRMAGAFTFGALTTTFAGSAVPGNACCIRSYVLITAR